MVDQRCKCVLAPGVHVELPHVLAVRRERASAGAGVVGHGELGAEPRPSLVHRDGLDAVPAAAGRELAPAFVRAQARRTAAEAQREAEEQRPGRPPRHCGAARQQLQCCNGAGAALADAPTYEPMTGDASSL